MNDSHLIHHTAIVDEGAKIGIGTRVWHFSHLSPDCTIGKDCIIGQNVFIGNGVVIGDGVKIQNNVSLYSGVLIEDDVFLGPSMVFTNVINPRSFIERKSELRQTIIRKGATIGANATIVCGNEVGKYALVGAGSVITKEIKPFALVYGCPAVQRGWVSKNAYALIFNDKNEASCPFSGEKYILKEGFVQIYK